MARVAVLMSGGVDSTCAALVLRRDGHEVVGLTGRMLPGASRCCGDEDVYRAERVCQKLAIPHVVADATADFRQHVLAPFTRSYAQGLTPNPCTWCNRDVKFGKMLDWAARLGAERVASGHYAALGTVGGWLVIREPAERRKSQTYFLALLRRDALRSVDFPLAGMRKAEVVEAVRQAGLPIGDAESQDLCFVPAGRYADLVAESAGRCGEGEVLDTRGRVVAAHRGHYAYTLGQRFGLRGRRLYVIEKRAEANQIVVGERREAMTKTIAATGMNYFVDPDEIPGHWLRLRYRYNSPAVNAQMTDRDSRRATFATEDYVFAPAPGQILACYSGDHLLSGGTIAAPD